MEKWNVFGDGTFRDVMFDFIELEELFDIIVESFAFLLFEVVFVGWYKYNILLL